MSDVIAFKYQELDDRGNSKTFFSKKGSFDGAVLKLRDRDVSVMNISMALSRLDKLLIVVRDRIGSGPIVLQMSNKPRRALLRGINRACSAVGAEAERQLLANHQRESEFRSEVCPHCESTVVLSRLEVTPEVYCKFCDSISARIRETQPEAVVKRERLYRCCDRCGYFSRPSEFTVFYFYFLFVVYLFRWGTNEMCNSCMRREAWKMLGANLLFILGVPISLYQLCRAYFGGSTMDPMYAGLDRANAAAKSGRTEKAIGKYKAIEERLGSCAGIRYNRALALMIAGRREEAAVALEQSLSDCANYDPACEALIELYSSLGRVADVQALRQMYNSAAGLGAPEQAAPAVGGQAS